MPADPEIVKAFGATNLFGPLRKRALRQVANASRVAVHGPGQEVTAEGDGGVAFHLVLEGTGKVTIKGKQIGKIGPGDYFGEIALIDGKPRTATVTATTELRTAGLSAWQFRPLLREIPGLAETLLMVLCDRIRNEQGA
jgi:CRP/FNR family cyclic AMP-dependent transcriptional regulator